MTNEAVAKQWRVVEHGKTPAGSPILMTWYAARCWEGVVKALGFRPVIVQGAFRSYQGGGARASAGSHDLGGAIDLRTRGMSPTAKSKVIRTMRARGWAAWVRTPAQGFTEEHIHAVLIADQPMSPLTKQQAREYVAGGDGLKGTRRDYHPRPSPLVEVPPTPPYAGPFRYKATGPHVSAIQRGLKIKVTGVYDRRTVFAVRAWKVKRGMAPTSVVSSRVYWGVAPK